MASPLRISRSHRTSLGTTHRRRLLHPAIGSIREAPVEIGWSADCRSVDCGEQRSRSNQYSAAAIDDHHDFDAISAVHISYSNGQSLFPLSRCRQLMQSRSSHLLCSLFLSHLLCLIKNQETRSSLSLSLPFAVLCLIKNQETRSSLSLSLPFASLDQESRNPLFPLSLGLARIRDQPWHADLVNAGRNPQSPVARGSSKGRCAAGISRGCWARQRMATRPSADRRAVQQVPPGGTSTGTAGGVSRSGSPFGVLVTGMVSGCRCGT